VFCLAQGAPVSELIQRLLLLINYEAYLKKSQQDWETRWENIQELINFASSATRPAKTAENPSREPSPSAREAGGEVIDPVNDNEDEEQGPGNSRYVCYSSSDSPP
jgi:ATP-dependent DNA helicase UvrD/PcrA